MRSAALALLLALSVRAGEDGRIRELVALLSHADPTLRRAARSELQRIGAPAVGALVDLIRSPDAEVRRFVRRFLVRELRAGDPDLRRQLLKILVSRGKGALGFVPDLESLARRYPGELGILAMIASMRIAGTRQHVLGLAKRPDAREFLQAFDPQRAPLLRAIWRHRATLEPADPGATEVDTFFDLVARAQSGAGAYLARRLADVSGPELVLWLDLAAARHAWPPEAGAALAKRLRHGSGAVLVAVSRALLRGPKEWAPIGQPVRTAALARAGEVDEFLRTFLVFVAARCADGRGEVLALLRKQAQTDSGPGFASLCCLRAGGAAGWPDPVERFRGLDPGRRPAILRMLALAGARAGIPILLDRLAHGDAAERRIVLASASEMPAARELLPGLSAVVRRGARAEIIQALAAAAQIDPELEWAGTESMLRVGLAHREAAVRARAVYACDDLRKLTPGLVQQIEKLATEAELAVALAWFLPHARRLGKRGVLLVPLLSRIVLEGPGAGLIRGGKSAVRWRRECMQALAGIDPSHPKAHAAFRVGLASSDRLTRLYALLGFRSLERPERSDLEPVRRLLMDKDESVRHAAAIVIRSPAWQQATAQWKKNDTR